MAYNFLTQYDSPNYTPASDAQATWGRPRTIEKIAPHWWGDPAKNPTFEGVVSWLCNPAAQVSAHFVATGTGRRVACLVNIPDASWATGSANPYTISIELDPRCRDEDYDVAAELIAELRKEYGDLPLMKHSDVVKTACPGNYDLARLDREARAKAPYASLEFGKTQVPPPAPAPTPPPLPPTPPVVVPTPLPTEPDKLDRIGAKVEENNALLKKILSLLTPLYEYFAGQYKTFQKYINK